MKVWALGVNKLLGKIVLVEHRRVLEKSRHVFVVLGKSVVKCKNEIFLLHYLNINIYR